MTSNEIDWLMDHIGESGKFSSWKHFESMRLYFDHNSDFQVGEISKTHIGLIRHSFVSNKYNVKLSLIEPDAPYPGEWSISTLNPHPHPSPKVERPPSQPTD